MSPVKSTSVILVVPETDAVPNHGPDFDFFKAPFPQLQPETALRYGGLAVLLATVLVGIVEWRGACTGVFGWTVHLTVMKSPSMVMSSRYWPVAALTAPAGFDQLEGAANRVEALYNPADKAHDVEMSAGAALFLLGGPA